MPRTVEIKCDGCRADLTTTGNCVDYRLALLNQSIPSRGGAVTSMGEYPRIAQDAYFCGVRCLADWLKREYPEPAKTHPRPRIEHQKRAAAPDPESGS